MDEELFAISLTAYLTYLIEQNECRKNTFVEIIIVKCNTMVFCTYKQLLCDKKKKGSGCLVLGLKANMIEK